MEADSQREQDEKAIWDHIDSIFRAFISEDKISIEKTHHPEWKGFTVRSRKTIHSRQDYLKEVNGLLENQHWKFYEILDKDVAFYGDTAVVVYIARISGKDQLEKYFETKLRVMDVYVKISNEWILTASSVSLHPDIIDSSLYAAISALTLS